MIVEATAEGAPADHLENDPIEESVILFAAVLTVPPCTVHVDPPFVDLNNDSEIVATFSYNGKFDVNPVAEAVALNLNKK